MINQLPQSLIESASNIMEKDTEYQKFFRGALKKFGVSSPGELSGDKEKEFYNYVDKNWKGKSESVEEAKVECPKCEGKGCDHCDDTGYHVTESTELEEMKMQTFKSLEDWVVTCTEAGGSISKSGNNLMCRGLPRGASATWELKKGRGSAMLPEWTDSSGNVRRVKEGDKRKESDSDLEEKKIGNMGPFSMAQVKKAIEASGIKGAKAIELMGHLRKSGK